VSGSALLQPVDPTNDLDIGTRGEQQTRRLMIEGTVAISENPALA